MEVQGFGVPPSDSHTTWALGACTVFRVPDCALHLPLGAAVGPPTLPQATVLAPLGRVCRGAPRSPSGRRGLSPGSAAPRGLALCWWELGPPQRLPTPLARGVPHVEGASSSPLRASHCPAGRERVAGEGSQRDPGAGATAPGLGQQLRSRWTGGAGRARGVLAAQLWGRPALEATAQAPRLAPLPTSTSGQLGVSRLRTLHAELPLPDSSVSFLCRGRLSGQEMDFLALPLPGSPSRGSSSCSKQNSLRPPLRLFPDFPAPQR